MKIKACMTAYGKGSGLTRPAVLHNCQLETMPHSDRKTVTIAVIEKTDKGKTKSTRIVCDRGELLNALCASDNVALRFAQALQRATELREKSWNDKISAHMLTMAESAEMAAAEKGVGAFADTIATMLFTAWNDSLLIAGNIAKSAKGL